MIGSIRIKYTGAVPGVTLGRRELNREKKGSWHHTGTYWHQKFRKKHFTKAGAKEYGYIARKGEKMAKGSKAYKRSYTGQKERKFGHTRPLEFSGLSRQLTRIRDVRAFSKKVRVVLHSRTFNRRHRKSQINMREEMTRVSMAEAHTLVGQFDGDFGRRLSQFRGSHTETIK